ncbi:UNVERIFIED_CONTAM: hypothetical protein FKN15_071363 [Acipenser sinensis]
MKCLREKGQGPRIDQYFLRSQSSQSNEIQRQEANHSSQDISTPVIDVRRTCMDTVSDEPNDPCEPGQTNQHKREKNLNGHKPGVKWPRACEKTAWNTVNTDLCFALERLSGTVEKKLDKFGDIIYAYGRIKLSITIWYLECTFIFSSGVEQMDPGQKAVMNHTFGVLPKRKHIIPCNICQLRFNSESQASAHYKGTKHAKKLKAQEAPKKKQKAAATKDSAKTTFTIITTNTINTSTDRTEHTQILHIIKISTVTKQSQASAHYKGTKHAKKLKAQEAPKKKQKAAATKDSAKTTFTIITTNTINTSTDRTDSTTGIPLLRLSTATAAEPAAALTNCSVQTSTKTTLGANKKEVATTGSNSCLPMETEDEKAKRLLYCSLCKVAVNSASQLEAHNSGTKHITMLEARSGSGTIKAFPRPAIKGKVDSTTKAITGLQNKTFHCEVCNVHVNSETQLKQHISSRRHKDRAAGKPPKPKYSPYNKAQRGTTAHAMAKYLGAVAVKPASNPDCTAPLLSPFHIFTTPPAPGALTVGLVIV